MVYYITMSRVGIIGGSGLYEIPGFEPEGEQVISTPYGEPSAPYKVGKLGSHELVFLPRHGLGHNTPPHKVNYRANITGFKELGVERIIAVCATGGVNPSLVPGSIVVLDQVLDFTQGARVGTFFEGDDVVHVDFTEPFCPELRESLIKAALASDIEVADSGTYVCVNGPRLESRAEIKHFASIGSDVVGMTAMPEAALAREAEICLSTLAVVTNRAAGMTGEKLTTEEVVETMGQSIEKVKALIKAALPLISDERNCPCPTALTGSRL